MPNKQRGSDKSKRILRLAFQVERAIPIAAFIELHRHENLIRSLQGLPKMEEDWYAREMLRRGDEHI
jgi:hypothetical protein